MNLILKKTSLLVIVCFFAGFCKGQLVITSQSNAQALAQKLVGDGVTISNATLVADPRATGFFKNVSGTNIGIDSGIVLTNGRAKTIGTGLGEIGLEGPGSDFASLEQAFAGDLDIEALVNTDTHDACVLEFDFVPLGDSIKFRYILSSEEYPVFSCSQFNDAFAFFIQGPGFPVKTNIALIPGTALPVTINNVNGQNCTGFPQFPQFFIDNAANANFTHNGHTTVLTALAQVQPCQTYHLKLVIADVGDERYDSGVFLEAKSLTSNSFQLTNLTQLDPVSGNSYLVEGCAVGALKIRRQAATLFSQTINLGYTGTAVNGVDVQLLPSTITIPANQTEVLLNIFPTIDNLPEGIETLKIYTLAPCGVATPTDSATIQIRDYDTLGISPDTAVICPGGSIQLSATTGYISYLWEANPGLSNILVSNPIATPLTDSTLFVCTSEQGTCHGRDSAFVYWKRLKLLSTRDVNCQSASTGQIVVGTNADWIAPVEYAIDNLPFQPGSTFNNLPVGTYTIKVKDATGCIDSLVVNIVQAFPDLLITNAATVNGSCTGTADAMITVTATGGKPPLQYSVDGTTFQTSNIFNVAPGTYTVTVKDDNGCTNVLSNISVQFDNTITLSTGANPTICESKNAILPAATNGTSVIWTPATALSSTTILNPVASPIVTTKYYIKSTLGICDKIDSVTVFVNPAPTANAGRDSVICYGGSTQLSGSGGTDYNWSPATYLSGTNVRNPAVTKPVTITYYLSVTDANGCTSLSKDDVKITVLPPAKLYAGADTAIAINQPLGLFALDINHIGFIKYHWSPETGLNNPFISNPVATLSDYITYLVVTASTASGCEGIDTIRVKTFKGPEIYVAGSFTPNGDGTNETLKAFPVGIKSFSYFRVYNRYGQLLFSTTNPDIGWDGKIKGYTQSMGTFVWMAEGIDFKGNLIKRKGTTILIQ